MLPIPYRPRLLPCRHHTTTNLSALPLGTTRSFGVLTFDSLSRESENIMLGVKPEEPSVREKRKTSPIVLSHSTEQSSLLTLTFFWWVLSIQHCCSLRDTYVFDSFRIISQDFSSMSLVVRQGIGHLSFPWLPIVRQLKSSVRRPSQDQSMNFYVCLWERAVFINGIRMVFYCRKVKIFKIVFSQGSVSFRQCIRIWK